MRRVIILATLLFGFFTVAAPLNAQTNTFTTGQAIEDLDRLFNGLQAANVNLFEITPEAELEDAYTQLRHQFETADSLTSYQLHLELQRFAALAHQSHTRIEGLSPGFPEYAGSGGLFFPLRFTVFGGEVIVTAAQAESPVQAGDRLLAVNGLSSAQWIARIRRNISAETDEFAYAQMALGDPYYVWLEYGAQDTFNVEISRGERVETHTLAAIGVNEVFALQSPDNRFSLEGRETRLLNENVGYLRPGPFSNIDAATPEDAYSPESLAIYEAFIEGAFTTFIEQGIEHIVLDLRDNPGGDNSFSDPVIAWFADQPFRFSSDFRVRVSEESIAANQRRLDAMENPSGSISEQYAALYENAEIGSLVNFEIALVEPRNGLRFEGEVHVLVNRNSFSNAVTTAALIQDYGFGTVYGEPTRDMATTFGAMEYFTLPNSGLMVGYPKAHIIRVNGEETLHPLVPDVVLTAPAVRGSDDVMLEALLSLLNAED